MSELGFWRNAAEDPTRLALVEPDGTTWSAGALLAESNRLVHGLRALGLERGDVVATVLPNGAPMIACYLAATQAGFYLVPINHHLTAPEIAYIVTDSAAKALVADARFGDACAAAVAETPALPARARFAVGRIAGFRPYAELAADQPDSAPADRVAGQVMNYTSGTTGRPKGVRRPLVPYDPDVVGSMFAMFLDDEGNAKPVGEPGTVYMALGPQDFEYHGDKQKTAANRRDGFFTVGDVGFLNEDGYLFLCDRKIDMIISGGANIYPTEVENVLLTHPRIADAAVFGIPDEDWGEQVKAVVEPAAGVRAGAALADDIIAFCAARIAKYKCPRSVDFVTETPRDPNGKLYKRKLRDPYWQGRARAI